MCNPRPCVSSSTYKRERPFEKRFFENKFLRQRFPNDVPLIVSIQNDTHKLLVPAETNGSQLIDMISSNIGVQVSISTTSVEKGVKQVPMATVLANLSTATTVERFHKEYKDQDGFVYLVCSI